MREINSRTLPGEKYLAALNWCKVHRDLIPPHSKIGLMHKETLYAFLEGLGAEWSRERKYWYKRGDQTDPRRTNYLRNDPWEAPVGRVSIRITAKETSMEAILGEFTELCQALDWHVVISPRIYPNGDTGEARVYIEVNRKSL